jgi:tRNA (Thr-GGU) A37 N-methylase
VNDVRFELMPIGRVESTLTDFRHAPKQGDEGAPEALLVLEPWVTDALDGIRAGEEVLLLTWLDRARRDLLRVHPRDDVSRPPRNVFTTRSADRPNPIGLHRVEVLTLSDRVCASVPSRRLTELRYLTSSPSWAGRSASGRAGRKRGARRLRGPLVRGAPRPLNGPQPTQTPGGRFGGFEASNRPGT